MSTPCSNFALNYRVSIHIGRKVEFILKLRSLSQTKYLDWFYKAVNLFKLNYENIFLAFE